MKRSGFTLVEVLVVITIITIIGLGAISVAQNVVEQSKVNKTETIMRTLNAAMDEYYRDTGKYPEVSTTDFGNSIGNLYEILNSNTKSSPFIQNLPSDCVISFLCDWDLDGSISNNSVILAICDGWYVSDEPVDVLNISPYDTEGGYEPMWYRNRGEGMYPQIISAGKDRIFNTADDIVSTEL